MTEDAPDWLAWHSPYQDPSSPLSRRLRIIQEHITDWLNQRPRAPLTAVSICAGQGHDLIGVLAHRTDADRVQATLLEYDQRNVAAARAAAETAGLTEVLVRQADAGDPAAYRGAVPADLVLLAGVFGNIDDADIRTTIAALPNCAVAAPPSSGPDHGVHPTGPAPFAAGCRRPASSRCLSPHRPRTSSP